MPSQHRFRQLTPMEISPVQRRIRDFYFKEGLAAPPEVSHLHRPNLVPDQQLFSMEHLRHHLDNPLVDLNYLNLFQAGKPVDLASARVYNPSHNRKTDFATPTVLHPH